MGIVHEQCVSLSCKGRSPHLGWRTRKNKPLLIKEFVREETFLGRATLQPSSISNLLWKLYSVLNFFHRIESKLPRRGRLRWVQSFSRVLNHKFNFIQPLAHSVVGFESIRSCSIFGLPPNFEYEDETDWKSLPLVWDPFRLVFDGCWFSYPNVMQIKIFWERIEIGSETRVNDFP